MPGKHGLRCGAEASLLSDRADRQSREGVCAADRVPNSQAD